MNKQIGPNRVERFLKRGFDLSAAVGGLVCLSPLMLLTAIVVRWRMGSPLTFSQERAGLGERTFPVYKFRTMTGACDAEGNLLPDLERLTPLGRWLTP